jgi:transcriptional regulator with XRE-family HTH domain
MTEELDQRLADVGAFIRTQREVARLSVRRLAEIAGVSNPYLSQIERGLRRPSAEILQRIAKALQISAQTLYERAGFLEPDMAARGVREALAADRLLSPEQQQALLNVYDSFVASARR